MHSQRIAHLDMKPANILVTAAEDRCKIADFGCSVYSTSETSIEWTENHDNLLPESLMAPATTARPRSMDHAGFGRTTAYRAPELQRGGVASSTASSLAKGRPISSRSG